jgi:hypothetical protein
VNVPAPPNIRILIGLRGPKLPSFCFRERCDLDAEAESMSVAKRGVFRGGDPDPSSSRTADRRAVNALDVSGRVRIVKTSVILYVNARVGRERTLRAPRPRPARYLILLTRARNLIYGLPVLAPLLETGFIGFKHFRSGFNAGNVCEVHLLHEVISSY